MVTIPGKNNVSRRDLSFLHKHILQQRNKKGLGLDDNTTSQSVGRSTRGSGSHSSEVDQKSLSDKCDQYDKPREPEKETPTDISEQIKELRVKLEALKETKHTLFQQLKAVLHEEDERKRLREEEHKEQLEKSISGEVVTQIDPRLSQVTVGMKHSLPVSPPVLSSGNQSSPSKKAHRIPLLPTPDPSGGGSSVTPFIRQGSGGSFHPPITESYHSGARQHYGTHGPFQAGHRTHIDQRFGGSNPIPQDVRTQGMHYQYAPTPGPMPYGSVGNMPQSSQMSFQPVVQQSYLQPHLHEMPVQSQPHPHLFGRPHPQASQHDITWQGAPHYLPQGGQLHGSQIFPDHQHSSAGYTQHMQDPRHQKIVHEHQKPTSVLNSPVSLQSPPIQDNQPNILSSPAHSPGHSTTRERAKKGPL